MAATTSDIKMNTKEQIFNGQLEVNSNRENVSPAENDSQMEDGSNDISCEMIIKLNNENNIKHHNQNIDYNSTGRYLQRESIDNECMSVATKIDSLDINQQKASTASCSNDDQCDRWTVAAQQQKPTTTTTPVKRKRGRRGSIVLELDCSTQSFGEKGTSIENYKSKLTTEDCNDSDDSLEDGELITNRKFEECATKSHRGWQEGDEVLTESEIKFRENEKVIQTKEGKKISEYTFRTDENHVSTTYSFEVLGDKVLRTAKTNRRSSTSSSMKMEKDSTDNSIKSSSDMDMLSLQSSSDIKKNQKEKADKYAVSFNSDTESSDEESDSEESSVDDNKGNKVINGDLAVNGDVTSCEATVSIGEQNVVCNGFKEEESSSFEKSVSETKSSSEIEEKVNVSKSLSIADEKEISSNKEDSHLKLDKAMDNITSELNNTLKSSSLPKENTSTITREEISEAYDATTTAMKYEKSAAKDCTTGNDKEFDLLADSSINKNVDLSSSGQCFSFTVDCSSAGSSATKKKKFTVCEVEESSTQSREVNVSDREECNILKSLEDKNNKISSSESETLLIDTSDNKDQTSVSSPKSSTILNEDIVAPSSPSSMTKTTAVHTNNEQNQLVDLLTTEQTDQNNCSATFSSHEVQHENVASTRNNTASNIESDITSKLPTALLDLDTLDGEIKLSSTAMESKEGNLIDISPVVVDNSETKLQAEEQQTKTTIGIASEKMAENTASVNISTSKMTNGDFKLSDDLLLGKLNEKSETNQDIGSKKVDNEINFLPKGTDINQHDLPSDLDNFRMVRDVREETMEFSKGAKPKKEFNNFEDELDIFGDSQKSNMKVMDETDGSKAYEKTTTYIAGDRSSTDDLIKRILAEARGEVEATNRRGGFRFSMDENDVQEGGASYESTRSVERSSKEEIDDHDLSERSSYSQQQYMQMGRGSSADREKEPSLYERRLASMGLDKNAPGVGVQGRGGYSDEYEDTQYSSRGRGGKRLQYSGGHFDDLDPYGETESLGSDIGSYKRQQFRSGLMRKQQAVYHDDESDDDDHPYPRRQPAEDYIPDEEFVPKKAEDTDRVVQERTEEIRKVVDNQTNVLQRLKSASDSFDEISNEIKEIKQQFLDSQMRRSMILDEIEQERMYIDQVEYEQQQQQQGQSLYGTSGRRALPRHLADDDDEFENKYRPPKAPARRIELDKELEEDRLGRGTLSSLAIGSGAKTSYSSYGASDVSSYRDRYKSKYTDDMDIDSNLYEGGSSASRPRASYGLTSSSSSRGRRGRSQSMFDDYDMDNDANSDISSSASKTRARLAAKYGLSLGGGEAQNGADDDDTASETSSYKSPNLPSYRKYDYNDTEQKSYGSTSYSSPYKSRYGSSNGNSRSASTSRLSNFSRSKTMDYTYDSPSSSYDRPSYGSGASKYSSSTTSNFSSRFLDKVRQKKAGGEEVKRDKPFTSRFLGKSVDLTSTPSFARPSFGDDSSVKSAGSSGGKTPEPPFEST